MNLILAAGEGMKSVDLQENDEYWVMLLPAEYLAKANGGERFEQLYQRKV